MNALGPAISRVPVARSKGILWGCILLPLFLIGLFFTNSSAKSMFGNGSFYGGPVNYIVLSLFLVPALGFLLFAIIQNGRLKRAPWMGDYLVGANVVRAGSNAIELYPASSLQKVEMRGTSTNLFVTNAGKQFVFPFRDLSHARWGEQQVQMGAQQPVDPFAFVVQQGGGKMDGPNLGWVIGAVLGIGLVIPIRYMMGAAADEHVFNEISYEYEYQAEGYLGRGGKHEAEVSKKLCDKKVEKAKTPPELNAILKKSENEYEYSYSYSRHVDCSTHKAEITAKIDAIYTAARKELETRVPEKAKPLLLALLDQSKAGSVKTKVTVIGPDQEELKKVDGVARGGDYGVIVPLGKAFDKGALAAREGQVKGKLLSSLNGLVKDNLLSVTEVTNTTDKPALEATIEYHLVPKTRNGELIVYRWEPDYTNPLSKKESDETYLGLTIQFSVKMKLGDITYDVDFEAPAASNFSVDTGTYGLASSASVYTRMVDTALDNTQENMSKRVFEKSEEPAEAPLSPTKKGTTKTPKLPKR